LTNVGELAAALIHLGPRGDWSSDRGLLGTAFPISEPERLFLGARHTLPNDPEEPIGIMMIRRGELLKTTVVEVGDLPGQPDVALLRTTEGAPAVGGLALDPPQVWEPLRTVGYPEGAVVPTGGGDTMLGIRALAGYVTRTVLPGQALGVRAPAIELSMPVPTGVSGGALFVTRENRIRSGLIGVCLANTESTSVLWQIKLEEDGDEKRLYEAERVVEFGIAARLDVSCREEIPMIGKTLLQVMGFGQDGAKSTEWSGARG